MLCIIPARAGSKRFPKKNLCSVEGKSRIARAISGALESDVFDDIIFSSDDPEALAIANDFPITCQERPARLGGDDVRTVTVVQDILGQPAYSEQNAVMVLFVTTPFRRPDHIRMAADRMESGHDSVLSIRPCPEPPQFSLEKNGDHISPWLPYDYFRKATRKQALTPLFVPNFAIQAARRDVIFNLNGFLGNNCGYVEMSAEDSVDIDTVEDLHFAEYLCTTQQSPVAP